MYHLIFIGSIMKALGTFPSIIKGTRIILFVYILNILVLISLLILMFELYHSTIEWSILNMHFYKVHIKTPVIQGARFHWINECKDERVQVYPLDLGDMALEQQERGLYLPWKLP